MPITQCIFGARRGLPATPRGPSGPPFGAAAPRLRAAPRGLGGAPRPVPPPAAARGGRRGRRRGEGEAGRPPDPAAAPTAPSPLHERLFAAVHAEHRQLAAHPALQAVGRGDLAVYRRMLADRQFVHTALEQAVAIAAECAPGGAAALAPLTHPDLRRGAALRGDMCALARLPGALPPPPPSAAARRYAAQLAAMAPAPLAVHAYFQYAADLAGGQRLRQAIEAAGAGAAAQAYHFTPAARAALAAGSAMAGVSGLAREAALVAAARDVFVSTGAMADGWRA